MGSLLVLYLLISGFNSVSGQWGLEGKGKDVGYGKTKKSDAVLEDDIMAGKKEKYDDPGDPPKWLLNTQLESPGLPTTPPPPPTMMLPPPELESSDEIQLDTGKENGYLRMNTPAFG